LENLVVSSLQPGPVFYAHHPPQELKKFRVPAKKRVASLPAITSDGMDIYRENTILIAGEGFL